MAGQVIDWNEAMQQCGDDEEFLRELLMDLKGEAETQLQVIAGIIQNPTDKPFEQIMRSAHMLKGASANLMCQPLRNAALHLEEAARAAHAAGGTAAPQPTQAAVQAAIQQLQLAVQQFVGFLSTQLGL